MYVAHRKDAEPQRATDAIFTGEVHRRQMLDDKMGKTLRMGLVKFSPGGRTTWHTHDFEQGLVILEGKGIVATEEVEHVVEAGDVVIVPQGEKHWHGGTNTTGMAHISITGIGQSNVLEPVDKIRTPGV